MDQFQAFRISLIEIDSCDATVVHLLEKLFHVRAALMPYPCIRKESTGCSTFEDTDTQVNVLAKSHLAETSQLAIQIRTNAHIERTRIEFVQFPLATSDSTCSEETRHAVVDGLLHRSE